MKRAIGSTGLALVALLTATGVVGAATRTAVRMEVPTTFDDVPDAFVATGLAGCATGVVEDGGAKVVFPPPHGVFAGDKVFLCDGSDSGLVVRLNARFGNPGSIGTWSIIASWGVLAGVHGSGRLIGDPIENGIFDHYTGWIVR